MTKRVYHSPGSKRTTQCHTEPAFLLLRCARYPEHEFISLIRGSIPNIKETPMFSLFYCLLFLNAVKYLTRDFLMQFIGYEIYDNFPREKYLCEPQVERVYIFEFVTPYS